MLFYKAFYQKNQKDGSFCLQKRDKMKARLDNKRDDDY